MQKNSRFGKLIERNDGVDFPFYNGKPIEIASLKWLVMILACATGFAALTLIGSSNQLVELGPRLLFTAIPLVAFIYFTKPYWGRIFRPLKLGDFGAMIVFWLLNLAVSAIIALVVSGGQFNTLTANAAPDAVLDGGVAGLVGFYLGTFIQLFGEELFTIIPFLAVLYWLYSKAKISRRAAIILAWVITAIWFGAAHLPTYGWNFAQAILVIGGARLVLTLAFIRTKNILVSFGAHLLNDWVTFTVVIFAGFLSK